MGASGRRKIIGLHKSNYINRELQFSVDRNDADIKFELEREIGSVALSEYLNRGEEEQNPELGHHVLITRGLPIRTGAELARLLDAKERKKDRTYRRYGGQMPRVACHGILSFPWGITDQAAADALIGHASLISDELKLPLEGRVHYVNARPDHAHLLIGTRVVEQGVLGPKQRALDAVSQKRAGEGLAVDGRLVGATIEKLRADWASRMREASGDLAIDRRSYLRRGIPICPVDTVPRGEIEFQKRRGRADWRRNRRAELEVRAAVLAEPGFWPQGAAVEADPTEPAPEDRQAVRASVLQTIAKRARAIASTTRKAREVADFVDPRAAALQDAGIDPLAVQLLVDRFDQHKAGGAASKRAVEGDSHASIIADAVPATASPDLTAELLRIADEATAAGGVKVDAQAEAAELGSERRRVARASVLQRIADQTRALTSLARQADEVAEPIDPRATALKDAGIDLSTAQLMVGLANQRQTDTPASKRMTARDSYDPRVAETSVSAASPDVTTDMASFEATPVVEAARQDERSDPRARALSALASRISRDHHNDYNRPGAVDAAVAIYVGLNRAHRLSAARVEKLAAAVVLEVPSFEALARAAMTGKQPDVSPQTLTAPTSPVLLALLAAWDEEDRAARAERRHNKKQDRAASDSADAAPASSAPPMKASVRQPEVAASGPSNDRAVPEHPRRRPRPAFRAPTASRHRLSPLSMQGLARSRGRMSSPAPSTTPMSATSSTAHSRQSVRRRPTMISCGWSPCACERRGAITTRSAACFS